MARRNSISAAIDLKPLPPLPIDEQSFLYIARKYRLSAQHTRIVNLLLRGFCRKQIVEYIGISDSTLTTHCGRIFRRFNVADRFELALLVLAEFYELVAGKLGGASPAEHLS